MTSEAATAAGIPNAVLLEEPQAALYSWVQRSEGAWRKSVKLGDIILVVDLGGGTSDFSLIAVTEEEGNLALRRVAVGDHILLGGDNMDLALAAFVKKKLEDAGTNLDAWQFGQLAHACRGAKETLLAEGAPDVAPITLASRGSKLIGGTVRTELTRAEIEQVLVQGFFPNALSSDKTAITRTRRLALAGPSLCARCGRHASSRGLLGKADRCDGRPHWLREPRLVHSSDGGALQRRCAQGADAR